MRRGRTCTRFGESYPSAAAAARALGVTRGTVRIHMDLYGNLDCIGPQERPVVVRGKFFPSQKAAAQFFRVRPNVVSTLLARWGHLDTLGTGQARRKSSNSAKPITVHGHEFPSRVAASRALGVCVKALRGWDRNPDDPRYADIILGAVMRVDARETAAALKGAKMTDRITRRAA